MDTPDASKANFSFTDGVRLALAQAAMAAREFRHDCLTPEHIALGVIAPIRDRDIQRLLSALDIESADLDGDLRNTLELGTAQRVLGELPYHADAKRVLQRAMVLSAVNGHPSVGVDHLFAALTESHREPLRSTLLKRVITSASVVQQLVECRTR
jgi:ATP-dependent Clp protease ATP-binding subunit ClpA